MSLKVNVTFRCDHPGCDVGLHLELPIWWGGVLSSIDANAALTAAGWGPPIAAGAPLNVHVYCPLHHEGTVHDPYA